MAAKFRKVDPRIWSDEGFEQLSPMSKLVALNIITGQSNRIGLFKFSPALGAEQCRMSADSYAIAIREVCDSLGWQHDEGRRVVFIPTWFKYNAPENPKHLKGCLEDLHDVPQTSLLNEFAKNDRYIPEHSRDTFRIAMGEGMAYQKQKQEQKQKSFPADAAGTEKKGKPRTKPTSDHAALVEHFVTRWRDQYGAKYVFQAKDGVAAAKVLKAVGTLEDACDLVDRFLGDANKFLAEQRHPLPMLVNQINRFLATAGTAGANGADPDGFVPVRPDPSELPWNRGGAR